MIDLHVHSTYSDGTLTPEELILSAIEEGLYAIALTDHDSTNGLPRFFECAKKNGIIAIPGVEISADFAPGTMHMLGYFFDYTDASLGEHLKWIRNGREARNHEMLHKLMALGCHITWEDVASRAGEDVVGRPHFAQALIEKGYVKTFREAFDVYLGKGKPGYAGRRRLSPEDSIELIRAAGGVPVLAHPFTLELGKWELRKLVKRLADAGLGGIELYYSEHTADMEREYTKLAKNYDLICTGGTDYHGMGTPDLKLGKGFGGLHVPDEIVDQLKDRATYKGTQSG